MQQVKTKERIRCGQNRVVALAVAENTRSMRETKDMTAKDRVTRYVCNASGSAKVPMPIIRDYKSIGCLKSKKVSIKYFALKDNRSESNAFVMWYEEIFLPLAPDHTRDTGGKVLLFMDNYASHYLLSDPEGSVHIRMFPPNSMSKHQPMDMGLLAAMKLYDRRLLFVRRTSNLADAEHLRINVGLTMMTAGTRGLAEDHPPLMLDTAQMLKLT